MSAAFLAMRLPTRLAGLTRAGSATTAARAGHVPDATRSPADPLHPRVRQRNRFRHCAAALPRCAFSLSELLAVVAIIAALAALLMPLIGLLRTQARGLKCVSNLRQLGFTAMQFADLNRGHLPGGAQTASGSVSWQAILTQEVLSGEAVSVSQFGSTRSLNCPEFRQPAVGFYKRPYALNGYIGGIAYGQDLPTPWEKHPSYIEYHFGVRTISIVHPPAKVLFQDTENTSGLVMDVWPSIEVSPATCWNYAKSPIGQGMIANSGQCAFRHGGGMPTLFVDLHAEVNRPDRALNSSKRYNAKL